MSSENWLLFKSPKEALRAKDYLAPLGGVIGIDDKWACWLDWKSTKRLELGVNSGSSRSGVHDFVRREVARRFGLRRIGHSCVGWYKDSEFEQEGERSARAAYPGYTSWVTWAMDYKVEWSHSLPKPYRWEGSYSTYEREYKAAMAELLEVEAHVVAKFAELDKLSQQEQVNE